MDRYGLAQKVRNAHSAGRTGAASSATPRGGRLPRHHHIKRGRFCHRLDPKRTVGALKRQTFVYLCTQQRIHAALRAKPVRWGSHRKRLGRYEKTLSKRK